MGTHKTPFRGQNEEVFYLENLDGLRFFSFLLVFLYHSFYTEYDYIQKSSLYLFVKKFLVANGNVGVNIFFVISGFLITLLLIKEKSSKGTINLKNFWIRRILRIWPLYYFCVLFGFVVFPLLKIFMGQIPNETAHIGYYLVFLNNFDFINNGLPDASILGVLWSVAIEEQFYLVWPILLCYLPKNKYWLVFIVTIFCSLLFRFIYIDDFIRLEHHTFSCMGDLAVGAMGAWLVSEKQKFKYFIENLRRWQIVVIYALLLFYLLYRKEIMMSGDIVRLFERLFLAVISLFIILEQCYSRNSLFKIGKLKLISRLGIITYGLYCLHFIGILITINFTSLLGLNTELWQVIFFEMPVSLLISIILAKISFKIYETPFLRIKKRFSVL